MSEVLLILIFVSLSCSLLGSLLVVNNQSPVADALSHSVLLGIVLAFFLVHDLDSPFLMVGATVFGLFTVYGIEWLTTQKLAYDAATGLVFSFFFAVAVILISVFARNVHLDMDMVLLGEVIFAPLYRMTIFSVSLPVALIKSIAIFVLVILFILVTSRRLALYLFDASMAGLVGIKLVALRLLTMSLVSLTIVVSFDAVGAISVISFLVAPAMTALFWAKHFSTMLGLAGLFAIMNVTLGYFLAIYFDLTVAGTCAFIGFLVFLLNMLITQLMKPLLLKQKSA
ncbi:metal ABC transporter permease [Streptococcus fryi]